MNVSAYHLCRSDGRICKVQAAFSGDFTLVIVRSCDLAEVNTEVDAKHFTERPINCLACIAQGVS